MNFRAFVVVLGLAFVALVALQSAPGGDPFNPANRELRGILDQLPAEDIAALKIRHADAVARFDVGVFGNSRAIQVSARDIGVEERSFFNFAVPGTSIRQSVLLLERRADIGKLPRRIFVSFDNAALEYYGNPVYPRPPRRWMSAVRDLAQGFGNPEIGLGGVARMAWRHAFTEWRALVGLLSAQHLRTRLFASAKNEGKPAYFADGSWPRYGLGEWRRLKPLAALAPSIMPEYLAYDLSRLAAIRAEGVRLLVYESPLAPGLSHASSDNAKAVRKRFLAACAALDIACASAPELGGNGVPPYWDDSSHAPGPLLGAWLAGQIISGGLAKVEKVSGEQGGPR